LEKVLDHILELLNRVDRGVVIIIDSEKGVTKEIVHRYKTPGDDATPVYCKDVVDRVLKDQKAVMVSDAGGEVEDELADTLELLRIGSVMCVPLIGTSKIMGALYVDSLDRSYGFRKEDFSLFNDIGRQAAIAIEYAFITAKL
jgi:GAF domain-containing protein